MDNKQIEELQDVLLASQWTYGQLFPEKWSPGQMPTNIGYKTHTFTSRFSDNVHVWSSTSYDESSNSIIQDPGLKGRLWVYFAPLNDLLGLSPPINVEAEVINNSSIFYSSSNGPLPYNENKKNLNYREITLNDSSKRNISLIGYKKLRVTSAAISIKQVGPVKERSGILKIGMSYKGAIENIPSIEYEKFDNYFALSKIVHLKESEEVICRYRVPQHLIETYAPFDPTTNLPYFFIYGEGISTNMSLEVEIVRHFEGIILSEYSDFHHQHQQPRQLNFEIQNRIVRNIEDDKNTIQNIQLIDDPTNSRPLILPTSNPRFTIENQQENSIISKIPEGYLEVVSDIGEQIKEGINDKITEFKKEAYNMAKEQLLVYLMQNIPGQTKESIARFINEHYNPRLTQEQNRRNLWFKALRSMGASATTAFKNSLTSALGSLIGR